MTKIVLLVRGPDRTPALPPPLRGPLLESAGLRERLVAAGATALQVNLADEPVADAMRITTGDGALTAVVSVWTDGDPADVLAVVRDAVGDGALEGTTVAGWEVEERRPLEPPASVDGERADALANVAVLRRPEELGEEEWRHRWLVDHTPVAIETQATFGYVQDVVGTSLTPDAPQVSAVVEELFPMAAVSDLHAFYGTGGDDAELAARMERMMASVSRFGADRDLELVPTSRYRWSLA